MEITRSNIAIFLTLVIFIISCGKTPTSHRGGKVEINIPNAIGMLWKYQVYDSLSQTTDTVWFSITDTIRTSSNKFITERHEKYFSGSVFKWQFLHFSGDTLEIFDDTVGLSANERIVFPLELGRSWAGPVSIYDTSIVNLVGQVEVPAAKFSNGARIDRAWNLDFELGGNWSQIWVVPNVGVVYKYFHSQYSDGQNITVTTNEVWELIDYDLATFGIHQFPNKVGTEWVYEEIDSTTMGFDSVIVEYDTVTVTIIGSGQFESGNQYTKWKFASRRKIDTQYVVMGEEQLYFQHDSIFSPLWDLHYDFPLAVGRTWGLDFLVPVPEVLDKERVLTSVQDFVTSFHTRMSGGGFNDYWTQEDWLVPGVGVVKSKRREIFFAPSINRTRILINYHL